MSTKWGYSAENGPATWSLNYAQAGGKKQSPIDINESKAVFDPELEKKPLKFQYEKACFCTLKNSGQSFTVIGSENANSSVIGGPVNQNHKFLQFHMHWGKDDTVGSEHTLNGKSFAAEVFTHFLCLIIYMFLLFLI